MNKWWLNDQSSPVTHVYLPNHCVTYRYDTSSQSAPSFSAKEVLLILFNGWINCSYYLFLCAAESKIERAVGRNTDWWIAAEQWTTACSAIGKRQTHRHKITSQATRFFSVQNIVPFLWETYFSSLDQLCLNSVSVPASSSPSPPPFPLSHVSSLVSDSVPLAGTGNLFL